MRQRILVAAAARNHPPTVLGRALLADVDWCVRQGVVQGEPFGELRVCDRMNECIVEATMALRPLRFVKFEQLQWNRRIDCSVQ